MANELKHASVGTELTQAEWESITAHILDAQATGDIIYAASASQLRRLAIGATDTVLKVSGGLPTWSATLAGLTLNAPVMQGTWTASGTVTLPAITMGGDISLGAYKLKTTNLLVKESDSTTMAVRDAADTDFKNLVVNILTVNTSLNFLNSVVKINTLNTDDTYGVIQARDNGEGLVEIFRMVSAADPYIQIGRDDTGVALNAVTDMLVLRAGGGTGNEAANFGLGLAINLGNAASQVEKRGYLNWVLATATDGSEVSRLDVGLMDGGALNLAMQLSGAGVLDVDLSSGLTAAVVGLFDEYDDAIILRKGISQRQLGVLEEIGVMRKKRGGSGWFLNVQAMLYLLAGGIYQTRERVDILENRIDQFGKALAGKI